ncbi:(2Fe-2S)-binding protein [Streptomyces sp. NRRL S-337]|uniref:(2Fe-2S)-binding protein n=1 Tax=Streptomyces sp. NRRL S-337 TaxID=1463900 RepID=UPI0004CC8A1B|nr:(2Fe-2S)-binding protein [Streptomyces sp. NRRL S-337]
MSEDHRHPQQPHTDQGWQPLPQGGEYESEATAFVQLPEGFTTGVYGGRTPGYPTPGADPLAAPGHGYTPPSSFTTHQAPPQAPEAGTDPSATGQWTMPFTDRAAGYADPSTGYGAPAHDPAHQGGSALYQGGVPEAARPWGPDTVEWPVAGSAEAAASWSIPAADDGLEESGEYLVGDDRLTGHPAGQPHPSGHPGHQGLTGTGGAGYQGGGYPGSGAYESAATTAETADTARTGHWNFTAGLSATSNTPEAAEEPQGPAPAPSADDRFSGPLNGGYAPDNGLADHGRAPGHDQGTAPDAAAAGATGHWSLPADALAQWPPAAETERPPHDDAVTDHHEAAADAPAPPAAAGAWTAPAAAEPATPPEHTAERPDHAAQQPDHTAEFAAATDGSAPEPAAAPASSPSPDMSDGSAGEATAPAGSEAPTPDEAPAAAADDDRPAPEDPAAAPAIPGDDDPSATPSHPADEPAPHDEHPAASYVLRVNGIDRPVTDAWIGESLLYVLRERLGLAGAKDGCSQGECGACSVQVDGRLVASCLVPAATTAGSEVRTVEGLAENGVPSDVQRALAASGAVQCGFCVPGMAMTVHDLLEGNHAPSELETRKALCGNLCRCSGYRGVLDAVEEVVKSRAEAAAAAYETDDQTGPPPADTARIPHQAGPADPTGHAPHEQDPHPGGSA